jgi:hypothetical protein
LKRATGLGNKADMDLARLAQDFASALVVADGRRPIAHNQRTGLQFQPGIGPHSESRTIELVVNEMRAAHPQRYSEVILGVPYPAQPRQKCDIVFHLNGGRLFVEAKLLRLLGDNGKPNDNMLMHILSPYPPHRSAVTDCNKLRKSGFNGRTAILIFGYSYPEWPLEPAIEAFEVIARHGGRVGERYTALFGDLCHPIHARGATFVWEVS